MALGLLENDQHWHNTLAEAAQTSHSKQMRTLFAIILTTCSPSDPNGLWENHKEHLSEDLLFQMRKNQNNDAIEFSNEIFNQALILIEDQCIEIANKTTVDLGLPLPIRSSADVVDKDLIRETSYNTEQLRSFVQNNENNLTQDQRIAYEKTIEKINSECGGILFYYASGGTGKTWLLKLILAYVRSQKQIAIAVASTGIAATLLDGGRTAHSALKLPLSYTHNEHPTCNIGKKSGY